MRMRNEKGQYILGMHGASPVPVGTVRIRTRYKRNNEQRAYVKMAEPNTWCLYSRYVLEQQYGPIPQGMCIHHKDGNKRNDAIENLELVSKAEHLDLHRDEYKERIVAGLIRLRKERRWSTKSRTKRTGHPRTYADKTLLFAIGTYFTSERDMADIAHEHGIPVASFRDKVRAVKNILCVMD